MIQLVKAVSTAAAGGQQAADGFIQNLSGSTVSYVIVPYNRYFPAGLVTSSANQINGLIGPVPSEDAAVVDTGLAATTISGNGSGGVFTATFEDDGGGNFVLTTIQATTAGSGYLVGDELKITTTAGTVINFVLQEGANDTTVTLTLVAGDTTAFPVKSYSVVGTTARLTGIFKSVPFR